MAASSDIVRWHTFLRTWNGVEILPILHRQVQLTQNATGLWGCSTYSRGRWFQLQWPKEVCSENIAILELFLILVVLAVWGNSWPGAQTLLTCHCDKEATVYVINKGSARDPALYHLMRCISFYSATLQFSLAAVHIVGSANTAPATLLCNDLTAFFLSLPQANPTPDPVTQALLPLAITQKPDWKSPSWRAMFKAALTRN